MYSHGGSILGMLETFHLANVKGSPAFVSIWLLISGQQTDCLAAHILLKVVKSVLLLPCPDPDTAILAARYDLLAIGRKRDACDGIRVAFQVGKHFACSRVPYTD